MIVSHLVLRGSRTVQELAEASGSEVSATVEAVRWLRSNKFVEASRFKDVSGKLVEVYSLAVYDEDN